MVGLGLGIVLSGLLMLVLGIWVVRQGVTIYVPTRVVAAAVGQEVERDSYVHLPQLLNGLQHTLPSNLAAAVFPPGEISLELLITRNSEPPQALDDEVARPAHGFGRSG